MREMGQSAWLSTSSLTLQGSEERVNAMDTGIGCNERILWSNNYSVLPVIGRGLEKARGNRTVTQSYSNLWNLPVNRSQPGIGKVSVDVREAAASEKLSD